MVVKKLRLFARSIDNPNWLIGAWAGVRGRSGPDWECIGPIYVAIYKQHHTDGGRMSGRNEHLLRNAFFNITIQLH